jgi:hypothetical protein
MFISQFISIIPKLVKTIVPNLVIADVNARMELWKVDVNPVGIGRLSLKKAGIPDNPGINRIFKRIGISGIIEQLVLTGRKGYPEITSWPGSIDAIAAKKKTGRKESVNSKKKNSKLIQDPVLFLVHHSITEFDRNRDLLYPAAICLKNGKFKIAATDHIIYFRDFTCQFQ